METVVEDDSPLADYLIGGRQLSGHPSWDQAADRPCSGEGEGDASGRYTPDLEPDLSSSPPSSPGFAPKGRPAVRSRFRANAPPPLEVDIPARTPLSRLKSRYSVRIPRRSSNTALLLTSKGIQSVVASQIDQADTSKFLEKFRYTIVASQLLTGHVGFGQGAFPKSTSANGGDDTVPPDPAVLASVAGAVLIAFSAAWLAAGGYESLTRRRLIFLAFMLAAATLLAPVYFKRQWLKFRMDQVLFEISTFVSMSQDLDSATGAAVSLIQEVGLVSHGYRMYVRPFGQARPCPS